MKNKLSKFFKNIYKNLTVYIAGLILVPAMVILISYNLTKVKESEKFSLFFTTDKLDNELLHNELNDVLKDFNLLQDYQYISSIKNQTLADYKTDLTNYGVSLSDFMLIPYSIATEDFLAYSTNGFKDYYEDGISYGSDKKVTYAVRVYDCQNQKGKLNEIVHYELEEDYYLCISKNSFHYSDYKNKEKSVLLAFIQWVTDYEK